VGAAILPMRPTPPSVSSGSTTRSEEESPIQATDVSVGDLPPPLTVTADTCVSRFKA
jgi:hypothetical protein